MAKEAKKTKACIYLFDFDNTLYDPSCGLVDEIVKRMSLFLQEHLNWSPEKAKEEAHRLRKQHGTITTGIFCEYPQIDLEQFAKFVHDFSLPDYLHVDQKLQRTFAALTVPCYVLSNGWEEYVEEGLRLLGVRELFKAVFGIRYAGFVGKPNPPIYERVIDDIGVEPCQVVYFDDNPCDLEPAKKLGMTTVWVHKNHTDDLPAWVDHHLDSICQLAERRLSC